ncbi:MAG: hypothetical protein E3K32_03275 [wastewater metagenome]|nr:hypothetical protein [Candidatus Loosdrechtia aerotolerans]
MQILRQFIARHIYRRRQTVREWGYSLSQKGIGGLVAEFKSHQEPYLAKEKFEILYQTVQKSHAGVG